MKPRSVAKNTLNYLSDALHPHQKAPPEPPSKFITEEVEVHIACQLAYIDLEGLNDGRAVKTIIPQVNPRRMVSLF